MTPTPPTQRGRTLNKIKAVSYAKLIKYLAKGDYSLYELADLTGLHYLTVCEYTRALHNERAIRITRWDLDGRGRPTLKVFALGPGPDAKRPPAMTHSERAKRYRDAKRARVASVFHVAHTMSQQPETIT